MTERLLQVKEMDEIKSDNLDLTLNRLNDPDLKLRRQAYDTLWKYKDTRILEALILALKDEDLKIREIAARSLGEFKNSMVVKPLLEILQNDKASTVRAKALISVSSKEFPNDQVFYELIKALRKDPDTDVRMYAASSLGDYKDKRAVNDLIAAIKENEDKENQNNADVRTEIAMALGEIGDKRALDPLLGLLNDSADDVRYYTAEALGQLGDIKASEPLVQILSNQQEIRKVRGSAARAIGELKYSSPFIIEVLQSVLDDEVIYADSNWFDNKLGRIAKESLKKLGIES